MNTYTDTQIATLIAAGIDLNEFFANATTAQAPAPEAPVLSIVPDAPAAPTTKPLTRSAWKSLRTTKAGKVRKAFAGLTREQALEAGLCEGYHMPTGDMRAAIREAKADA